MQLLAERIYCLPSCVLLHLNGRILQDRVLVQKPDYITAGYNWTFIINLLRVISVIYRLVPFSTPR